MTKMRRRPFNLDRFGLQARRRPSWSARCRISPTAAPTGFSLLELLVAMLCTTLIVVAVGPLLVGSAAATRQRWSAIYARTSAHAALGSVADDIARAGRGLEDAVAVARDGAAIAIVGSAPDTGLRIVRTIGETAEISGAAAPALYLADAAPDLDVGVDVVGVDLAGRPPGAPLPLGRVMALRRGIGGIEVAVGWAAAEAAAIEAWGEPRALVPVRIRDYGLHRRAGSWQWRRRDEGGYWQPVADGLQDLRIGWAVDSDGDGVADARRVTFSGAGLGRACAVSLQARAVPWQSRRGAADPRRQAPPQVAARWVDLPPC